MFILLDFGFGGFDGIGIEIILGGIGFFFNNDDNIVMIGGFICVIISSSIGSIICWVGRYFCGYLLFSILFLYLFIC